MSAFLSNISKLIYSLLGLALLLSIVGFSISKSTRTLPQWIIDIGGYCMGVYLFQQFILKALYNYTQLPTTLGPYILPWVGFFVTLIVSLFFSYLLRKTKIGRYLVG